MFSLSQLTSLKPKIRGKQFPNHCFSESMFNFKGVTNKSSRWWFQICLFHPYYWEDSHYDRYFLDGLKPPTSQRFPRKQGEQKRESMCKSYALFHLFHCKYDMGHNHTNYPRCKIYNCKVPNSVINVSIN